MYSAVDEIITQKGDVQQARLCTHSGDLVNVILKEKEPVFVEVGHLFIPTGESCPIIPTQGFWIAGFPW